MVEKLKKTWAFIITYYYSLLLCLISLWLSYTLFTVDHHALATILFTIVAIKFIGMLKDNGKLRMVGIIGLNAMWTINTTLFLLGKHPPVELTFEFPLFILILGFGVALRGRFNE